MARQGRQGRGECRDPDPPPLSNGGLRSEGGNVRGLWGMFGLRLLGDKEMSECVGDVLHRWFGRKVNSVIMGRYHRGDKYKHVQVATEYRSGELDD